MPVFNAIVCAWAIVVEVFSSMSSQWREPLSSILLYMDDLNEE